MSDRFLSLAELCSRLETRSFERPPALVSNAHVTGLGVARALARHEIPVIVLDRASEGVAPDSEAVEFAAEITYPLDDLEGYSRDLEAVADALDHTPVAFGCMDEWVHALSETRPRGVELSFAPESISAVLDKTALYARCADLGVPYPETYRLREAGTEGEGPPVRDAEVAADELGFPLVLKPARKRAFEELAGANVVEVCDREAYNDVIELAAEAGVRLMAQERVDVAVGEDRSLASYVPPAGEPLAVVGNARARYPASYGTSCVVDRVEDPTLRDRGLSVLTEAGYHGISEAEFVYDRASEEYVLLDVNTRPWKWIGMPVAAGANLPMAAYADATNTAAPAVADEPGDVRWLSVADYLRRLADGGRDVLSEPEWRSLLRGEVDGPLVTSVYHPGDPGPARQLLRTEFGDREYYCAC